MLKLEENPPILPEGIECLSDLCGDWWAAHTRARSEKSLAWDLLAREVTYVLPMSTRTVVWGGRRRSVLTPIFPSYVFINGGADARQKVLSTNRVCQMIPVRQRDPFVGELDAILRALRSKCRLDLYPFAAVGRRCRVARGPLQGIEGIVIRKDDVVRIVLQVSILSQGASLEIDADLLEPAD